MVSFSCEACGDVLTKKKLDQHRSQCRGASFSCLDCSVHFQGTDYRTHTSCITEDQKYQGALYKPKASKSDKRKSVSIAEPRNSRAIVPRAAYVEDAPEFDIPPAAPSPPPAVPARPVRVPDPVNVFDFLVAENTPNASQVSLGGSHEQMSMKRGAQSIFSSDSQNDNQVSKVSGYQRGEEQAYDETYEEHGFSYGADPVQPIQHANTNGSLASLDFMTPAAKATRARIERAESVTHSRTNSGTISDKKRKRGSPEALDLSAIHSKGTRRREHAADIPMADAPPSSADTPSLSHSGLTGGLNRLLTDNQCPFPPTPDYSDEKEYAREMESKNRHSRIEHPASPLKRSRHSKDDHSISSSGAGFAIKGRAGRIMSMVGGTSAGGALSVLKSAGGQNKETALVKTKHRNSSSDDGRHESREPRKVERKKHRASRPISMFSAVRRESSFQNPGPGEKHSGSNASNTSRRRRGSNESPEARRRKVKAIDYPTQQRTGAHGSDYTDSDDESNRPSRAGRGGNHKASSGAEMVVFGEEQRLQERASAFLSYVTKGPDSERGCSVHKALKRWNRDSTDNGYSKEEEQKELWRGLRLRRNERGEVVVFFAS